MKSKILFSDRSTSVISPTFFVMPNNMVMLSAWGFAPRKTAIKPGEPTNTPQMGIIQKLAFEHGNYPDGAGCGAEEDALVSDPRQMYAEDVTQCGLWNLSACQNLVLLTVPGSYRIELNDTAAIGNIFMTITWYLKQEIGFIPSGMFLGDAK